MLALQVIGVIVALSIPGHLAQDVLPPSSTTIPQTTTTGSVAVESSTPTMTTSSSTETATSPATSPGTSTVAESSSVILTDMSSTSMATNKIEDLEDRGQPTWELIYPDQNATFSDDPTMSFIDHTISMPPKAADGGPDYKSVSRYFKVDDVMNCEKYFGECLRQVLTKVIPKLRNGDDAARIPPIDPFYINRTSFQYNGGPLNGRITVGYAFVYGLTSMKYRKVLFKHGPGNSFKVRLSTVVPNLLAKGSYKADLKLNSVNVRPQGDFNITLYGVAIEQLATGEIYERDQHTFLRLTYMNVTAALRDAKINATGLIPDMRLNDIILNVANQYWREIFNIILPETRDNWSPIIKNALNGALAMVPFDFLKKL